MEKTDTWAAFGSEYLKAIEVASDEDEYAIVGVESKEEEGKVKLNLKLQRDEIEKLFGLNKTNLQAVQLECPNGPKESIGRVITFYKVDTQTPKGEPVKGLRLKFKPVKLEEPKEVDTDSAGLDENNNM